MTVLAASMFSIACLVVLIWISRHVMIYVERRKGFLLSAEYPGPPDAAPRICVVVAAKDEQDNIETCVRTMIDQDYPNFELLVCNDRSEDATAEIVEAIAAENPRVRLLNIEQLPDGWCGKNNAMQQGIATTDGEWICMIDADCTQTSPRTLSTALQYAIDTDADLLSVLPTLEMHGFWENVIQPVCSGVMMIYFTPEKVNNPKKSNAYANGAFMLIKRSVYEQIGTHEVVKGEVNEDMHMAAILKQAGLNLRVTRNDGLYKVRMYTSLGAIIRGWSRIFYGTFGTLRRLCTALAVLLMVSLSPYIFTALGFGLSGGDSAAAGWWKACGIAGATAVIIQLSVIYRFYALLNVRKRLFFTYPLGSLIASYAVIVALLKLRKGAKVTWRGTSYTSGAS